LLICIIPFIYFVEYLPGNVPVSFLLSLMIFFGAHGRWLVFIVLIISSIGISVGVLVFCFNSKIHLVKHFFIFGFNHFLSLIYNLVIVLKLAKTWLIIVNGWFGNLTIVVNNISSPEWFWFLRHLISYFFLLTFVFVFKLSSTQSSIITNFLL
jgi:hypothetical protein